MNTTWSFMGYKKMQKVRNKSEKFLLLYFHVYLLNKLGMLASKLYFKKFIIHLSNNPMHLIKFLKWKKNKLLARSC